MKYLKSNILDFGENVKFGSDTLMEQYIELLEQFLSNEEYEKAAELRDEAKKLKLIE